GKGATDTSNEKRNRHGRARALSDSGSRPNKKTSADNGSDAKCHQRYRPQRPLKWRCAAFGLKTIYRLRPE
ncbi:MAG TPA: hypothetical protein VKU42_01800, partial [Candidatus Angelobacter sp.]|nr:hypothetical protein [Candidatus Angelobacter sp.]